jgi:hypothetical protein
MAIEKTVTGSSIEIVGQYKILFLDSVTEYTDDGVLISSNHDRTSYPPNTVISELPTELQDIANLVWTSDIISSYNLSLTAEE